MKKLILLLVLIIPMGLMAQGNRWNVHGSMDVTALDTIVKVKVPMDCGFSFSVNVSELVGVDGEVELVVANTVGDAVAAPADDRFIAFGSGMSATISTTSEPIIFEADYCHFDWVGLKFTKNTATSWNLTYKYLIDRK